MKKRALYIVITIILFMTTLNICIRQSVSTTLAEWEVGKAFVFRMNDTIDEYYSDEDIDTLVELQNKMLKEKSIKAITNVYVDYAINSIVTSSDIKIQDTSKLVQNMAKESIILIEKELNVKTDHKFYEDLLEECESGEAALLQYVDNTIIYVREFRIPVLVACLFVMPLYRNIGFCFLAILVGITYYFETKKDWIKAISKCLLITFIAVIIFSMMYESAGIQLSNHILGRTQIFIMRPFIICLVILFASILFLKHFSKRI